MSKTHCGFILATLDWNLTGSLTWSLGSSRSATKNNEGRDSQVQSSLACEPVPSKSRRNIIQRKPVPSTKTSRYYSHNNNRMVLLAQLDGVKLQHYKTMTSHDGIIYIAWHSTFFAWRITGSRIFFIVNKRWSKAKPSTIAVSTRRNEDTWSRLWNWISL